MESLSYMVMACKWPGQERQRDCWHPFKRISFKCPNHLMLIIVIAMRSRCSEGHFEEFTGSSKKVCWRWDWPRVMHLSLPPSICNRQRTWRLSGDGDGDGEGGGHGRDGNGDGISSIHFFKRRKVEEHNILIHFSPFTRSIIQFAV